MRIDRKENAALSLILGAAVFAYQGGEGLKYSVGPAPYQIFNLVTASSTAHVAGFFNTMTFERMNSPPPIVPPEDRQEQGGAGIPTGSDP
jgi:hypothetical protein